MEKNILLLLYFVLQLMPVSALAQDRYKETLINDAPFLMAPIKEYIFPEKNFPITDYGAKEGGKRLCTKAFQKAMAACSKAGGGYVVVPKGRWLTGAIHFKSNCNLRLEEGAVVEFSDSPADYLPAVHTTWEGVECYNYSPLVYAYDCENVAISGKGKLAPKMRYWKTWFNRPASHIEATRKLYTWCSEYSPMEERQVADTLSRMRPHLIQFNRCRNILLENFTIRESPFWTIHMYMCNGGIVRGLDVYAHGHNNDGIDIDMTKNFLIEDCTFDQGDDAVVIKAGHNQDAWRLDCPTENIVIRHCTIKEGHTLLGIGSELSGGIRNVYMTNCAITGSVLRLYYVKTNHRRGGFVENVWLKGAKVNFCKEVVALATDVVYQWKNFPDYETRLTRIDGLHVEDVSVDSCETVITLMGDKRLPARNISIKNLKVGKYKKKFCEIENVENIEL